ncbi:MAG: hypothetical protein AB8B56_07715 [Crocinitomicaceae bacterium]
MLILSDGMDEVIDSNINPLIQLVEEYISRKRNSAPLNNSYFQNRLERLGYSSDEIQELLIEIDDDADKELLAGEGTRKAKRKLVISLIVGVLGMIVSIVGAFVPVSLGVTLIPLSLIGGSFVIAGRAYTEIGLVKKRRSRRAFKYQNWM